MAKMKHSKWGGVMGLPNLFYEDYGFLRVKPENRPCFRGACKRKFSDKEWRRKLRV